jgi:hypothetical protein
LLSAQVQLRDREELQLRESQQRERERSAAKSSKKSTQEEVPDDSDQGGQDDGEGDGDGEEHNEGDGNGEEHECHDDDEDVDGKDQDEEDGDCEDRIEGGGNGGNSTASGSDSASKILVSQKRRPGTQKHDSQDRSQKRAKKAAQKKQRNAPQTPQTPENSDDEPLFKKPVSTSVPSTTKHVVEELLLFASNPVQNPHHAWALVRLHCQVFVLMKHDALFGQESLGNGPGHALLPVNHPLWTALGVPDGSSIDAA